jgi:hypothetical protein
MRRILMLVLVLAVCASLTACGSSSPAPSTSTTSPQRPSTAKGLLTAMRSAARSQHSVHYVSVSSAPDHKIRLVGDVATKVGILRITLTDHGQTGAATVMVSDGTAFMRGDAFMLRTYFGLTKAQATKYAAKWISVPGSNPGYATISDGVTFPSYLSHLFPLQAKPSFVKAGSLTGVRGTVQGQGSVSATTTIFAPAHGKPLPVKQTAKSSGALGSGEVTMSNWNEAVHVTEPTAVSISIVVGA